VSYLFLTWLVNRKGIRPVVVVLLLTYAIILRFSSGTVDEENGDAGKPKFTGFVAIRTGGTVSLINWVWVTHGYNSRQNILISTCDTQHVFRLTLQSQSNKAGLKCPSVCLSVHKIFLRFQWSLACKYRSMSDARRYTVWPNPRSRSRALESWTSFYYQKLSPPPFTMGAGNWPQILKLGHNI